MGLVTINGVTYSGNNIIVKNNLIMIDGVDLTPEAKEITITANGHINLIQTDLCKEINVSGNVENIRTESGDIHCTHVGGNVITTSGNVECDTVIGNVGTTSGDVRAKVINGSVSTVSGDIKHNK